MSSTLTPTVLGVNNTSPTSGVTLHSTGQTHQLGTLAFTNTATSTNTAIRAQINLNDFNRTMEISNNGQSSLTINATGNATFSQPMTAPTITATTSVTAPTITAATSVTAPILSATTLSSSGVFTPSGTGGIAPTLHSTVNINTGGGGSTQTITFTKRGIYLIYVGSNYNDYNLSTTFVLTHSGTSTPGRILTLNNPGWGVTLGTVNGGFTISASSYPANYNAFDVSYIYFAF